MATLALANALKDFSVSAAASPEVFAAPSSFPSMPDVDLPAFPDVPEVEPVDVDALIAEAVADAELRLTERLAQEHAETLQAERDRHAQDVAELQQQFADEASTKILAGVEEMERRLIDLTGAVAARILGVVLTEDIRNRSVQKLADIIGAALTDDDTVRIRVRGSLPFFDALKTKLPNYADQLDFAESPNYDLSVTIDDSVYETRLAEWSSVLAEALSE